ncbi:putative r RNA maturation factor YbeY [Methyloglobulus morosus KoM1]|uniref:Endoribonuclease YbeY n=1 Tax=Methyloglobulus morosus KoM1 TaxID=1116472 RepID=V5E0N4_9GAMM|nr:rRNA maturation RNase YbeY [Methyloglobulus morosus]ESS73111.1 putative r RNA maturation factor YbeY [Methyloglobulus morosus KoM1]
MNLVELQIVFSSPGQPDKTHIQQWIDAALQGYGKDAEIVVRIVGIHESAELNKQYRHKQGPTNILSFPADIPEGLGLNLLGDLVICAPVIEREAMEQQKQLNHHWAHIVIHGVLHLLGYDHVKEEDADIMEDIEIKILQALNISNPYLEVTQP